MLATFLFLVLLGWATLVLTPAVVTFYSFPLSLAFGYNGPKILYFVLSPCRFLAGAAGYWGGHLGFWEAKRKTDPGRGNQVQIRKCMGGLEPMTQGCLMVQMPSSWGRRLEFHLILLIMPADTDWHGMWVVRVAGTKAASWRGSNVMWAVASPILILVSVFLWAGTEEDSFTTPIMSLVKFLKRLQLWELGSQVLAMVSPAKLRKEMAKMFGYY